LSQKLEVDSDPYKPCDKAAEPHLAAFEHCEPFTYNGEISFVEVTERSGGRLANNATANKFARIASLLHCNLRNSWQRPSILIE